jgi:hypothetical protein
LIDHALWKGFCALGASGQLMPGDGIRRLGCRRLRAVPLSIERSDRRGISDPLTVVETVRIAGAAIAVDDLDRVDQPLGLGRLNGRPQAGVRPVMMCGRDQREALASLMRIQGTAENGAPGALFIDGQHCGFDPVVARAKLRGERANGLNTRKLGRKDDIPAFGDGIGEQPLRPARDIGIHPCGNLTVGLPGPNPGRMVLPQVLGGEYHRRSGSGCEFGAESGCEHGMAGSGWAPDEHERPGLGWGQSP